MEYIRGVLQWATRLLPFSRFLRAESDICSLAVSLIIELPPTVEVLHRANTELRFFVQFKS